MSSEYEDEHAARQAWQSLERGRDRSGASVDRGRRRVRSSLVYKKIERPEPPKVDESAYVLSNEIDRFVVDRLVSEGLEQSPEADRSALARRVALDLTGLPPSLEEVDAFVTIRVGGHERFVDRH